MKSAKRVKGRPIIGESRTEEIEKTLGSTGGSAPMVELEEDFSEKYGHRERSVRKTQVVVALDIGSAASRAMAFSKAGEVLAQSQSEYQTYFQGPAG
jgi:hypothetical protein